MDSITKQNLKSSVQAFINRIAKTSDTQIIINNFSSSLDLALEYENNKGTRQDRVKILAKWKKQLEKINDNDQLLLFIQTVSSTVKDWKDSVGFKATTGALLKDLCSKTEIAINAQSSAIESPSVTKRR